MGRHVAGWWPSFPAFLRTVVFYRRVFKPALDRLLAAAGVFVLSPVLLVLATLIGVRLGRPILFRQTRIGLGERPFVFLKFRTMTDERDAEGALLPDAQRLTPF